MWVNTLRHFVLVCEKKGIFSVTEGGGGHKSPNVRDVINECSLKVIASKQQSLKLVIQLGENVK